MDSNRVLIVAVFEDYCPLPGNEVSFLYHGTHRYTLEHGSPARAILRRDPSVDGVLDRARVGGGEAGVERATVLLAVVELGRLPASRAGGGASELVASAKNFSVSLAPSFLSSCAAPTA